MAEEIKKLMFVHNVAEALCCTEKHVYDLINEGKLDAIRMGKRALRVTKESVIAFIDQNKVDPEQSLV